MITISFVSIHFAWPVNRLICLACTIYLHILQVFVFVAIIIIACVSILLKQCKAMPLFFICTQAPGQAE